MRPIKLKMSAFGPYIKPIELDFVKGLGENNFFLINGATGSGKTTILDAICYALYGESSGGGRKSSMMRSEQASANDKTEVEFTFTLHGKNYRIIRSPTYERPKLRGEGMTEEKASAKIFEDEKIIDTKNVTEYVENLLGFGKNQFRQVIVLPQGDFKKFLLATSNEKQPVLNKLFNAEFFERVGKEIKIKAADAKAEFENLNIQKKSKLEDAGCTEEELPIAIKNLEEKIQTAQSQIEKLSKEANDAQTNYNNGENLSKLFKDFERKSATLSDAEKLYEEISNDQSLAKEEYDKRQAEEPRREDLKVLMAELGKKQGALKKLKAKQEEFYIAKNKAKKSSDELFNLNELKAKCDKTMLDLKTKVEKLKDAPAKLEIAKQNLQNAQNRNKLLTEIKNLREKEIPKAEREKKSYDEAEKNLADLRETQRLGRAALLAQTLKEGKPCPVCGALHHPNPAGSDSTIPTDEEIKFAEYKVDTLSSAEKNLSSLQTELKLKEEDLAKIEKSMSIKDAKAEVDKNSAEVMELDRYKARIKCGEVKIAETEEKLKAAQSCDKENSDKVANLRGEVNNMTQEIDLKYLENPELLEKEIFVIKNELDKLNKVFNKAQKDFNELNNQLSAQKAKLEAAQKNKAEISAQIEGKTLPNMELLRKNRDDAQVRHNSAIELKTKLIVRLEQLNGIKISAINEELKVADKNFQIWKTLSDVANGKISFQRYYLSTMFAEVINEANNRLEKMSSGRYRFQNKTEVSDGRIKSAGLDLEILDDYTGTARAVETLSGGESFLASLSLALGLAAVVQNNSGGIKLETIFIDEGFGTLDSETLDFAMKTLMELQNGGRLVGIISHVEELKHQIPVRLEVKKTKAGSVAEFFKAH